MRLKTKRLMKHTWRMLLKNEVLNGFEDEVTFALAFEDLGEVDGHEEDTFICRKQSNGPFSPQNIKMVTVKRDLDLNRIVGPAFKLEGTR